MEFLGLIAKARALNISLGPDVKVNIEFAKPISQNQPPQEVKPDLTKDVTPKGKIF